MEFYLNGKKYLSESTSIKELIAELNLSLNGLVILINDNVVKKDSYDTYYLKESDKLEILNFVSGG